MDRARLARLAAAAALLALGGLLLRGYVTDDTYIHLRYARHLVELGELSFNAGEPTYGCSSPLWVFGLALLLRLGVAPLVAPWLLGAASALLALLLFDAIAARLPLPRAWRLPLLLLFAADTWFVRWTWSGMETPLATALLLMLLWPLVAVRAAAATGGREAAGAGGAATRTAPPAAAARPAPPPPAGLWFAWGVAAGLAGLTRPEFLLLAAAAWPWLLGRAGRARPWRAARPAALGALAAYGPWLLYAWRVFGRLAPETAAAKSYAATADPAALAGSLLRSVQQLGATQAPLWLALLGLAALTRSARRRFALAPPAGAVLGIALTWAAILAGGYAVLRVWVISRYVSPLSPALLLAAAVAAAGLLAAREAAGSAAPAGAAAPAAAAAAAAPADVPRPARPVPSPLARRLPAALLVGGLLATLAVNGWLLATRVRPHARGLSRGLRECLLPLGEWLRANAPADASVACLDIGAIGWASERRVVDLYGLVSPELVAIGREQGFPAMVASGAWLEVVVPDYLVDRTDGPARWAGRRERGVAFTPLDACTLPGLGVTEPQTWTVTLYELTRQ